MGDPVPGAQYHADCGDQTNKFVLTIHSKITELRRQSSAPEFQTNNHLAHPELGLLGNHLNERCLASFLMILHDSFCSKQRTNTLLEVPPAFDLVTSRKEPLTLSLIEPASIQNLI